MTEIKHSILTSFKFNDGAVRTSKSGGSNFSAITDELIPDFLLESKNLSIAGERTKEKEEIMR